MLRPLACFTSLLHSEVWNTSFLFSTDIPMARIACFVLRRERGQGSRTLPMGKSQPKLWPLGGLVLWVGKAWLSSLRSKAPGCLGSVRCRTFLVEGAFHQRAIPVAVADWSSPQDHSRWFHRFTSIIQIRYPSPKWAPSQAHSMGHPHGPWNQMHGSLGQSCTRLTQDGPAEITSLLIALQIYSVLQFKALAWCRPTYISDPISFCAINSCHFHKHHTPVYPFHVAALQVFHYAWIIPSKPYAMKVIICSVLLLLLSNSQGTQRKMTCWFPHV